MMNIELSTKSKRVAMAHEMLDAGFTRKEIAEAMGLKYHTVVRYFNSQEKPIVTDAMLHQMLTLHQEAGNWSEVARQLGTTRQVIQYWREIAKRRGIA